MSVVRGADFLGKLSGLEVVSLCMGVERKLRYKYTDIGKRMCYEKLII